MGEGTTGSESALGANAESMWSATSRCCFLKMCPYTSCVNATEQWAKEFTDQIGFHPLCMQDRNSAVAQVVNAHFWKLGVTQYGVLKASQNYHRNGESPLGDNGPPLFEQVAPTFHLGITWVPDLPHVVACGI